MFPIFVVVLFLASVGTALNVSIQNAVPTRPSFSIQTVNQPLQACGQANIEDVVDASSSSEIILWKIGTVSIKEKETSCKVTLAIRYAAGWSYAISDVSWRGRIVLEPDAQATVTFKAAFQSGPTAFSNTWVLRDQPPGGGLAGLFQPKGDFRTGRDWEDRKLVEERNQVWSSKDQVQKLEVEWKVAFSSTKTRGMVSVLGDTKNGGNPLALRIGLRFRK